MWDTLKGDSAKQRAESHYAELRDNIWKEQIEGRARIVRFENTQQSATEIVKACHLVYLPPFWDNISSNTQGSLLQELLARIGNGLQQQRYLQDDRTHLLVHPNRQLDTILSSDLRDLNEQLTSYSRQLLLLKSPPRDFKVDTQSTAYRCLLDIALSSQRFFHEVESALAQLPSTPCNTGRRSELTATLESARRDFVSAYQNLRSFGRPPPKFQTFIPTITLTISERRRIHAFLQNLRLYNDSRRY
ncbi:hypothetical protein CVT24_005535 [Panaeolus cyanescens]|uniref:Uncharacterized protein n=1 Tax=Panaeolus cyanescens TaxID=181874 RepID=A0A409VQH9_9AGAR|nr:hypothetical protein CVT24_005535 [Panaeolus cyanescens]